MILTYFCTSFIIYKVLNPLSFSNSAFRSLQMLLNRYKLRECNMYMNNQEINPKVFAYSKSLTYKLTCKTKGINFKLCKPKNECKPNLKQMIHHLLLDCQGY